jgi:hypothetical protein
LNKKKENKKEKLTDARPKRLLSSINLSAFMAMDMLSFVHKLMRGKKLGKETSDMSSSSK